MHVLLFRVLKSLLFQLVAKFLEILQGNYRDPIWNWKFGQKHRHKI